MGREWNTAGAKANDAKISCLSWRPKPDLIEFASNWQMLNSNFQRTGILFVLSAPSGAGKTTLCSALRHKPDFVYAVSCTTRAPRTGEIEGEDYHFLSDEEFDRRVAAGEFLEYAEVAWFQIRNP